MILILYTYINISIYKYNSNRIFNIRTIPKGYRVTLLNNFIDKKYNKDSILMLGDSQTNGYLYPEKDIFTTLLTNKLNKKILNLAYADARILDNIYILEYMKKKNMKVNMIVFSVNGAHLRKADNFQHLDESSTKNYSLGIITNLKPFLKFSFSPTYVERPTFNKGSKEMPLPNDFFYMNNETIHYYSEQLLYLIKLSKIISTNTVIYITPYSRNRVLAYNKNSMSQLNIFAEHIKNICEESNVKYYEPDLFEDDNFFDIVHFNLKGHQKMAESLYEFIKYGNENVRN